MESRNVSETLNRVRLCVLSWSNLSDFPLLHPPPPLLPHVSSIYASPQSYELIPSSPDLLVSLSFLLHQHPYHFWFITPCVKAGFTSNLNKTVAFGKTPGLESEIPTI